MKERLKETASTFFIIVTLINIAVFVLGLIFRPNDRFGYEIMIYPVIYGAVSSIPGLVMNTTKELSVKQTVIREIIQIFLTVAIVLIVIFGGREVTGEMVIMGISVAVSVVIIYFLVIAIRWKLDTNTATRMTADLEKWKEKNITENLS